MTPHLWPECDTSLDAAPIKRGHLPHIGGGTRRMTGDG